MSSSLTWSVLPPGLVIEGSGSSVFTSVIRDVEFDDIPTSFKPGISLQGKVTTTVIRSRTMRHIINFIFGNGHSLKLCILSDMWYWYLMKDFKLTALV